MRGRERGRRQSQGRRRPCAAGGRSATMLSHWVVNHLRVIAGGLEHEASPGDCSTGWRAGTHQETPTCCARCLNPHSRVVGAPAHRPATFHKGVGRAEYPELLEPRELSAWLCPYQHPPGTRWHRGKGREKRCFVPGQGLADLKRKHKK